MADDFFDAIAENGDGVALLIDMQNREICISTGWHCNQVSYGCAY